ncbi:hypothetical protein ACJX0J_000733, partial (mitochondrion) [Zea mays]
RERAIHRHIQGGWINEKNFISVNSIIYKYLIIISCGQDMFTTGLALLWGDLFRASRLYLLLLIYSSSKSIRFPVTREDMPPKASSIAKSHYFTTCFDPCLVYFFFIFTSSADSNSFPQELFFLTTRPIIKFINEIPEEKSFVWAQIPIPLIEDRVLKEEMQEGTFKKEGQRTQALMPKQSGQDYFHNYIFAIFKSNLIFLLSIVFYLLNIAFLQFIDIAIIYIEKMIANLLANSNYLKFKRTVGRRLSYTFVAFSFRTLSHVLSFIKYGKQINISAGTAMYTNNMTEIDIEYQKQKPDMGFKHERRKEKRKL